MNKVDQWWERRVLSLEQYRTGANLSFADKRAVRNPTDIWKIALIENIIGPCQDILYRSFHHAPQFFRYYHDEEEQWMHDEWHYLGLRLGRAPTSLEKEEDFLERRTHTRFRLFYCLNWPENMEVSSHLSQEEREQACAFLARADEITFGVKNYVATLFSPRFPVHDDTSASPLLPSLLSPAA